MAPVHTPLILSGTANRPFARRLAKEVGTTLGRVEIATFSDNETHVVVSEPRVRGREIYIVQPTSIPTNQNIMELLAIIHGARSLKPKRITAVMPFFGYRRQEKTTQKGESLTFQLVAKLLKAAGVSRILVIDLHKHRSKRFFKEVGIVCKELRAFDIIVAYFRRKRLANFVVLAPDKGGIPESDRYARALGVPLVKVYKHRSKRDEVVIDRFIGEVEGKNILIVDDEVNTAGTLASIVEILKKRKARNIYFACTHAVLSGPAVDRLRQAKIRQVIVTDTIFLPPKKRLKKMVMLSVVPLFADAIATWSKTPKRTRR